MVGRTATKVLIYYRGGWTNITSYTYQVMGLNRG